MTEESNSKHDQDHFFVFDGENWNVSTVDISTQEDSNIKQDNVVRQTGLFNVRRWRQHSPISKFGQHPRMLCVQIRLLKHSTAKKFVCSDMQLGYIKIAI